MMVHSFFSELCKRADYNGRYTVNTSRRTFSYLFAKITELGDIILNLQRMYRVVQCSLFFVSHILLVLCPTALSFDKWEVGNSLNLSSYRE